MKRGGIYGFDDFVRPLAVPNEVRNTTTTQSKIRTRLKIRVGLDLNPRYPTLQRSSVSKRAFEKTIRSLITARRERWSVLSMSLPEKFLVRGYHTMIL
jgi:hypothetical protein